MNEINFWENSIVEGYYDQTISKGLLSKKDIQSQWHEITYKNVVKLIDLNSKVLDFACGSGTFLGKYLKQNGFGTDIVKKQIDYANRLYGQYINFFYLNDVNLTKNAPYEVVTILGLIEFLSDAEIKELLIKLKSVSKNGTKFIITTPNYGSSIRFVEKIANKIGDIDYSEVNVSDINKKKLFKILIDSGFVNIKISKIVNYGVFFSMISNRLGYFMDWFISKITAKRFGFILLAEATVKN